MDWNADVIFLLLDEFFMANAKEREADTRICVGAVLVSTGEALEVLIESGFGPTNPGRIGEGRSFDLPEQDAKAKRCSPAPVAKRELTESPLWQADSR